MPQAVLTEALAGYLVDDGVDGDRVAEHVRLVTGRPVVTRTMARSIGLCAGAVLYLRSVRRSPAIARVLVAGADRGPGLAALLFACGLSDISLWNVSDERWLPLRTATRDVDVIIDLLGSPYMDQLRVDLAEGSVVAADDFDPDATLAPGILAGLAHNAARRTDFDHKLMRRCVDGLADGAERSGWPTAVTSPRVWAHLHDAVQTELTLRRL
ncbi:hypothetical protein [Pseudonocardia ailaonensis]|uniref:hypothetical protein n=1 Tax=Pseudonocardia ailaonensis TaxID=367279 RepID=UPI0031D164E4